MRAIHAGAHQLAERLSSSVYVLINARGGRICSIVERDNVVKSLLARQQTKVCLRHLTVLTFLHVVRGERRDEVKLRAEILDLCLHHDVRHESKHFVRGEHNLLSWHCKLLLVLLDELSNGQVLQALQFLQRRQLRRLHDIFELSDGSFEWYDFALATEINDLGEKLVLLMFNSCSCVKIPLVNGTFCYSLIVLERVIFSAHLFNQLVAVSQVLVLNVLQ